jgi:hypothetical protein
MGKPAIPRPARPLPSARSSRRLRAACLASALVALTGIAHAERLPLTPFASKDGLASDRILCIVADSRGFLWLCHNGQLSRFDGERFVHYGAQHGLPGGAVRDLLEAHDGTYLLATAAGVHRFDPRGGERLFVPLAAPGEKPPGVHALLEARDHRVWAGTGTGLYEVLLAPDPAGVARAPPATAASTSPATPTSRPPASTTSSRTAKARSGSPPSTASSAAPPPAAHR